MRRCELYRIDKSDKRDPKKKRTYIIVSRSTLLQSKYPTIICAPVFSSYTGLSTQVPIGINEGMKHDCCIQCDSLISLEKNKLTDFVGSLNGEKIKELNKALRIALHLDS